MADSPVVPVKPGFWSTITSLYGMLTSGIHTATTIVSSVDDLALALKAQTELIKDTSINDADVKRIALDALLAARKASVALPDSSDL